MIKLTPENLKNVIHIGQYGLYLKNKCVVHSCQEKPKLYYENKDELTAWSLCKKCKEFKESNWGWKFIEYSEKDLFTIRLYET